MATILLVWAVVEDWEVVDGLSDSLEKALQAVSSHLPNKVVKSLSHCASQERGCVMLGYAMAAAMAAASTRRE